MSQLDDYNKYVNENSLLVSLMPCASSNLLKKFEVIFEKTINKTAHVMVNRCRQRRSSYFTCIQYKPELDVVQHHVCDIFPVMVGSNLDINICRMLEPDLVVENYPSFTDLSGMTFVDGSLSYIPYLLTNRKELGHKVKRRQGLFCLYIYDIDNRGHKLSIDSNNKFTYRNQRGEDDACIDNAARFTVDNVRVYMCLYINFLWHKVLFLLQVHLNHAHIKDAFVRIYNHPIEIDSLENKLTLSPVNILNLMLLMAQRTPMVARDFIVRGELEKFASIKIVYSDTESKKNSWSSSFNYRKLHPNQILKVSQNTAIHNMERIVVRPIPKNVSRARIPQNTEYFLCMAEKSIAIDSPNRWLLLLPNVMVSNTANITEFTLNHLLNYLYARRIIDKTISYERGTDRQECIVLVNGGLLTHYSLQSDVDTLIINTKQCNPYIEIFMTAEFVMFNLTLGIPFIPFVYKGHDILVSPLELNTILASYKISLDSILFGPNCSAESIEMAQYATLNKMMVATNYFKNRFTSNVSANYFEYTAENMCAYIDENNKNFNKNNSMMNFDMVFSSHPQITADSYVLSRDINCNSDIYMRSRLDLDIQTHMNIFFNKDISSDDFIVDYDRGGNVIKKYICVAKIQKIKEPLRYRIFPQTKLFMNSVKTSNGHDHYLYKYFDERYQLDNKFDVALSIICDDDKKRKKFYIDIVTRVKVDFYDGFKISDQCSQKGLVVRQDLSKHPMKPQLIGSIFSIIGRSPIIELKCIAKKQVSFATMPRILYGNYSFAVLKNISALMKSYSPLKIDIYSAKILSTNGLNYTMFQIQQDAFNMLDRGKFLPAENQAAVGLLSNLKIAIEYTDAENNRYMNMSFLRRSSINNNHIKRKNIKRKSVSVAEVPAKLQRYKYMSDILCNDICVAPMSPASSYMDTYDYGFIPTTPTHSIDDSYTVGDSPLYCTEYSTI